MGWWCGPGMVECRDCHVRRCTHGCHPWGKKAQVNATNRTLERVEFETKRGPDRANESDPLATVSTRPKGA
jgi:hypothetical protein